MPPGQLSPATNEWSAWSPIIRSLTPEATDGKIKRQRVPPSSERNRAVAPGRRSGGRDAGACRGARDWGAAWGARAGGRDGLSGAAASAGCGPSYASGKRVSPAGSRALSGSRTEAGDEGDEG